MAPETRVTFDDGEMRSVDFFFHFTDRHRLDRAALTERSIGFIRSFDDRQRHRYARIQGPTYRGRLVVPVFALK
jgi:hypothetical protein